MNGPEASREDEASAVESSNTKTPPPISLQNSVSWIRRWTQWSAIVTQKEEQATQTEVLQSADHHWGPPLPLP